MFFKKILFSDYDWTLNEHDYPEVYKKNLEAIRDWRERGNLFAVATGRGPESLRSMFADYENYCDFCVLCDGAYVVDNKGKIIHSDYFGPERAEHLRNALNHLVYRGDRAIISFTSGVETPDITAGTSKVRLWFAEKDDCVMVESVLKTEFSSTISFTSYYDAVFNDDIRLPWVNPGMRSIIEVECAGTSKQSGILKIADCLCIKDKSKIITVGDDLNDVEMIRHYNGYAVECANPKVKELTPEGHIIPHVHNLITKELSLF